MPATNRRHHTHPHFVRNSPRVKAAAYADPSTRCIICGRTLAEGVALWGETRAAWDAAHVNDGEVAGALGPGHAHCNRSDGARRGNAQRSTGYPIL